VKIDWIREFYWMNTTRIMNGFLLYYDSRKHFLDIILEKRNVIPLNHLSSNMGGISLIHYRYSKAVRLRLTFLAWI